MPAPSHSHLKMIRGMETIQKPIGEISTDLTSLVGQVSYFELTPFEDGIFTSGEHDVALQMIGSKIAIDVSEPICGQPNLEIVPLRDNSQLRQEITLIWDASRRRKKLLSNVMNEIYKLNSGRWQPNGSIRMTDIANVCDLHITTVSRILDNKICLINDESVPCRDFIFGLRKI